MSRETCKMVFSQLCCTVWRQWATGDSVADQLPSDETVTDRRCEDGHAATHRHHARNDNSRERLKVENITERCRKARLRWFVLARGRYQE